MKMYDDFSLEISAQTVVRIMAKENLFIVIKICLTKTENIFRIADRFQSKKSMIIF